MRVLFSAVLNVRQVSRIFSEKLLHPIYDRILHCFKTGNKNRCFNKSWTKHNGIKEFLSLLFDFRVHCALTSVRFSPHRLRSRAKKYLSSPLAAPLRCATPPTSPRVAPPAGRADRPEPGERGGEQPGGRGGDGRSGVLSRSCPPTTRRTGSTPRHGGAAKRVRSERAPLCRRRDDSRPSSPLTSCWRRQQRRQQDAPVIL